MGHDLKADTAGQIKRIGPAVSVTDGIAVVNTLDIETADQAVIIKNDGTVIDISGGTWTWAAVAGADGLYDLTFKDTDVSLEGSLDVYITDEDLNLVVREHFNVLSEGAYASKYNPNSGNFMSVNITQISGDGTAADDLEIFVETLSSGRVDVGKWLGQAVTLSGHNKPDVNVDEISDNTTAATILETFVEALSSGKVLLGDDAITAAAHDESTAYPLKSADTGSTAVARTGADSDTLETISDEIAGLNDFDPASDDVAVVILVGTTTTNSDLVTAANVRDAILNDATQFSGADIANILTGTDTTIPALIAALNDIAGIQKNATLSNFEFLMYDRINHVIPKTGLTVSGQRSLDGGAFVAVSGAIAEVGNGVYQFDAAAADTNCDLGTWRFYALGADDTFVTFKTE